jgi:hypothetical protein
MKHAYLYLAAAAVLLAACGQTTDNSAHEAAANAAQVKKKPAFCFFKDEELKGWAASRDKDGNISLKGQAHVKDSRYRAVLGTPTVTGTRAEVAPSIVQNDTGYGAPEDWWDLSAIIPSSAAVDTVAIACGAKTIAELKVPPKS